MSSDASRKRDLHSAYKVQVFLRTLRNICLTFLGLCFFLFFYIEISRDVVPDDLVVKMRRFENSSKFNNFNDLIAPDWDKNKSEICPGPCLPDFDNDGILDNQGHLEKLIQDVEPVLTPYGKEVLTYDITGLKVYIYDLPAKFNSDLAKCASKNRANSMCFDFANTGFGPKMDINIKLPKYLRFYKTHQFSLEVIFHEKLLRSPHLTTDPKQATLFYVPYYAALSCFCNIETGQNLTSEFWSFAQNLTYLETGKVHFMALGKVEQEMSSLRCPFLRNINTDLFKYLIIERSFTQKVRKYFFREGKDDETLVIPYPSYGHFDMPYVEISGSENRTIKVMLAGSPKSSELRKTLIAQLGECSSCVFYRMSPDECYNYAGNIGKRVVTLMTKSVFCLHPPGDTPTRKSFFDGIIAGCIPVVFNKQVAYPFDELFRYDTFTVFVDEDNLTKNNRTHIVNDILDKIPESEVIRMQGNVASVARFMQYGSYGYGDDAFATALRLLLHVST